jgi:hypothetical protein
MTTSAIPNPGSNEALLLGCQCPVLDNGHGRGYLGGVKAKDGSTVFVYNYGCPVHFPRSPTVAEPPHEAP